MTVGAVIKHRPLPWGGVRGGRDRRATRGGAERPPRYHRVVRNYFETIAEEVGAR